jgi:hypothetical protein
VTLQLQFELANSLGVDRFGDTAKHLNAIRSGQAARAVTFGMLE